MTKTVDKQLQGVLDQNSLEMLGSALQPLETAPGPTDRLRAEVMARIDAEESPPGAGLRTIRLDEGPWVEIAPRIKKKVLHLNVETGTESYLLRVEPGAEAPPHVHEHDELCLVLEGEFCFDDLQLSAGDYHFAPKGSHHGTARSETGAVVFIQTGAAGNTVAL